MLDDVTVPLNLNARAALPERFADPESEPTAHRGTANPRSSIFGIRELEPQLGLRGKGQALEG